MAEPRFARIGVWEGSPDDLERWRDQCTRVKTGVQSQPGACGAYFLLDRESGRALTLTLWESEEARAASETFRSQSQETTADRSGAQASTERYEIVDWFRTSGLVELELTHGSEPAPRTNQHADEHVVLLEGRVRCHVGDDTLDVALGKPLPVPRGSKLRFEVDPPRIPGAGHPAGFSSGRARVVVVE
jgi:mannose-6-phosphate isomerase-like protein (cupin superfamily)